MFTRKSNEISELLYTMTKKRSNAIGFGSERICAPKIILKTLQIKFEFLWFMFSDDFN